MAEPVEERLARALSHGRVMMVLLSDVREALKLAGLALHDPATHRLVMREDPAAIAHNTRTETRGGSDGG